MRRNAPRLAVATALASLAAAVAGCGSAPADLFVVTRTAEPGGGGSPAPLMLVVSDDGSVSCNGKRRQLPGSLLLDARQLQRDLDGAATEGEVLGPGPRPVYAYAVRTPAGALRFADDSPHQPSAFQRLAFFTLEVEQRVCSGPG